MSHNVKRFPQLARRDLVLAARTFDGVPWKDDGRNEKGMDCVGLIIASVRKCGCTVPDHSGYGNFPGMKKLLATLDIFCETIPTKDAKPGDIVFMHFGPQPRHVGLITELGVIHSSELYGKVCEHGVNEEFKRKIKRAYRIRGSKE